MAKTFTMGAKLFMTDMFSNPINAATKATQTFKNITTNATATVQKMAIGHIQAAVSARNFAGESDKASKSMGGLDNASKRTRDSMGRFTASANQGKAAAKGLGDEAKKSGNILEGMLGKAKALVAAFAIGAVVTTSFGSAMNFEEQLSSIKALTGASAAEMQQMQSLSLKMGAATKYNALEAAKGIEELLKAGLTPAQVKAGALEAGLNLATAGGLDLAKAAEIMSTALNAFRKDGMSAAQASNILAGTANASAASVEELQYGLAQVGAVAAGVGLSFKDTNVALGTFANYGLKGSDAGTSLKTFLGNLQPVTDKQTALFKKLGLVTAKGGNQFFTAAGKINPSTK
jgi:hypothetical protein